MLDTCNEQFDILYISIIIVQATVNVGLFYAWTCTRFLVELALAERDSKNAGNFSFRRSSLDYRPRVPNGDRGNWG